MSIKTIAPALLLSSALLAAAAAQERAPKVSCDDPQTQAEMNICAGRRFAAADAKLNRVYDRLVAKLGDDGAARARLKTAELSWLKYRDDNCEYESAMYEGGSMRPLIHSTCLERMTKARTAELLGQIKDLDQ